MRFIPEKFRPLAIAVLLLGIGWGAYFATDLFDVGTQAVGGTVQAPAP